MKMNLQKFNDENPNQQTDPQKNSGNSSENQQQPNDNTKNTGKSDNEKYFMNVAKKMNNFMEKMNNKPSSNDENKEKKPSDEHKPANKTDENKNDGYEERISNLEKQLHDQQDKSNKNDLAKYTQKKIKDTGLNVDDDTFNHLKGATKDAIDKNIDWYKGLADKFNKPNQPTPKKLKNNSQNNNNNTQIKAPKPKSFENGIGKFLK